MSELTIKKKIIFTSILLFASVVMALIVAEIYIRITSDYYTPETLREKSLQYVPSLFSRHIFPQEEQYIEKKNWLINSEGYRGSDFSLRKDSGVIRVIVYGGSAAFDLNLPGEEDWPSQIEVNLKSRGLNNVEVINAGIPGHASFDSFGRLFSEGHIFSPDYVLLYNAWNDIKYFTSDEPLLRKFKPYNKSRDFRINYNGSLDRFLCEVSQLYVHLRTSYYNNKYFVGNEGIIESSENNLKIKEQGPVQYKLNVDMFVDLARNIDAVPVLVTQARLVSSKNSPAEKSKIGYDYPKMDHQTLVQAFQKTDEIIKSVAKTKRVRLIDASAEMTGVSEYFTDHVHLSKTGSGELARIVSDRLFNLIKDSHK